MSKRFLFAATAAAALGAVTFATPSEAQITGYGNCRGVSINSAWVDWGSGMIRANVYNHNGDNSTPATVRFKIRLSVDGKHFFSDFATVRSRAPLDVDVTSTHEAFGKSPSQLQQANHKSVNDPYSYFISGNLLSLTDCTRS